MNRWKALVGRRANPLAAYVGKPAFSDAGPDSRYLGRVILELWEVAGPRGPAISAAYGADPAAGDARQLAEKAAVAFSKLLSETQG